MNNNEETKDITYYQKENERLQEGLKTVIQPQFT